MRHRTANTELGKRVLERAKVIHAVQSKRKSLRPTLEQRRRKERMVLRKRENANEMRLNARSSRAGSGW